MIRSIPALLILFAFTQTAAHDPHRAFEGVWNSATATPLERPAKLKDKAFFTKHEAAEWEREFAKSNEEPPDDSPRRGTGTYNTFYREYGTHVFKTLRTSVVIDPPDGRIPPLTPAADEIRKQRLARIRDPQHPEDMGLQDQCVAFATAGPPMLPYSYNSNYQIAIAKDAVVIYAEMIHDARIVYMDGRSHAPAAIGKRLGDSIGRWDGNTLVVDTTNFLDGSGYYGDAGGNFGWDHNLHLTERFSLMDANTLLYQFDIDDPSAFTKPWRGEETMTRSSQHIYEYACHEGNYSLPSMLKVR